MIKAFLIDSDDTLTLAPDRIDYRRAAYEACKTLFGDRMMKFAEFSELQHSLYLKQGCWFQDLSDLLSIDKMQLFNRFHQNIRANNILFDHHAAACLRQLQDRAVIYTDGSGDWVRYCGDQMNHGLDILARDDGGTLGHRKAYGDERWQAALDVLRQKTGEDLAPENVLMIDDHAAVLQRAQSLGFKTAQCHWGHPGRALTNQFDFSLESVGDFLLQQGFAQNPISSPALHPEQIYSPAAATTDAARGARLPE